MYVRYMGLGKGNMVGKEEGKEDEWLGKKVVWEESQGSRRNNHEMKVVQKEFEMKRQNLKSR